MSEVSSLDLSKIRQPALQPSLQRPYTLSPPLCTLERAKATNPIPPPHPRAQVPLCAFLGDQVPGLAAFAKEGEQTTVLDALTDAAEALQMLDLKPHAPEAIPPEEQVGVLRARGQGF